MPSERIAISNINQFIGYAKQFPELLNIGGFTAFRSFATPGGAGCSKCGAAQNKLLEMRPQFEASFAVLSTDEQQRMKRILDTDKVCYYTKLPGGQLKTTCF